MEPSPNLLNDRQQAIGRKALGIYDAAIKKEGLFGKAYFGHKASKSEKKRMTALWAAALKQADREVPGGERSTETDISPTLPGPEPLEGTADGLTSVSSDEERTTRPRSSQRSTRTRKNNSSEHHREGTLVEDPTGTGAGIEPGESLAIVDEG